LLCDGDDFDVTVMAVVVAVVMALGHLQYGLWWV
jgi:hypothetical protein